MMGNFRIEGHKLRYHVSRVNQWLKGEDIYPIYVEIAPSGGCNHRCTFCALDYLNYRPRFIDKKVLTNWLSGAAECGVKSVMYAGEGEPLLHKDMTELIIYTEKVGIDVAITTNAVFFNEKIAKECLGSLTWMRVSLDAGTKKTYARIHRCKADDFDKVLSNLSKAVKLKKKNNYTTTIGVQTLLLPENQGEISRLAEILRDIGADYLIIKPFSKHPLSPSTIYDNIDYSKYLYLTEPLQRFSNNNFKVIFRIRTMKKLKEKKPYRHCLGLPFWAYIDSGGNIYACSAFLGDERFCYGNIYKNNFKEIWHGTKRKQILNIIATELDTTQCREICRLDEINRYLWELKHPHPHVNFI